MEILQLKSAMTKIKSIHELNSRSDLAEQRIDLLKIDQQRLCKPKNREGKKMRKNEKSLKEMQATIKHINIYTIGILQGEKRKKNI